MVFQNNLLMGAAGATSGSTAFSVGNSCIFETADSAYLNRTFGTPTDNKKWTYSTWVKRGNLADNQCFGLGSLVSSGGSVISSMMFGPSNADTLQFYNEFYSGTGSTGSIITNNLFRDPHAWYHVVMIYDSNNDITTERMKLFVNGKLVSNNGTATYPSDGTQPVTNSAIVHYLGRDNTISNSYFSGYLAECVFCDGQAYGPENFGEYDGNNIWRPKDPSTLTFGDNGFYLDFADSSDLGNDVSGNNNDWTSNNLASGDQSTDTPTANQCVLSPLWTGGTLSQGNLTVTAGANAYQWGVSSMAIPTSGKWVCEFVKNTGTFAMIGVCQMGNHNATSGQTYGYGYNIGTGEIIGNGSVVVDAGGASGTSLMRVEYDADNDTIEFFDDGTEIFPASTGASNTVGLSGHDSLHFWAAPFASGTAVTSTFSNLSGTPSSGFKELSAANLTTPTIKNPQQYFDTFAYLGNGEAQTVGLGQAITDPHEVSSSALFVDDDDTFFSRTPASAGNRRAFTFSFWLKRTITGSQQIIWSSAGGNLYFQLLATNQFQMYTNGSGVYETNDVFEDIDQWHNFVMAFDSANSTASNRFKLYIDGVQITDWDTETAMSQDTDLDMTDAVEQKIGRYLTSTGIDLYGYMAEVVLIDGTTLDADSFGQIDTTTNRWVPKDVSGLTFGTTGFYLDFADKNDLGDDESGNGNDWTENGFDTTNGSNQFHDTPTRNFATFNPFEMGTVSTFSQDGNLHFTTDASGTHEQAIRSTFHNPKSGKWYAEFEVLNVSGYPTIIPFASLDYNFQQANFAINGNADYSMRINASGEFDITLNNVSETVMTVTGFSYSTGDVVQLAIDCDNDQFWMGVNDSWNAELGGDPDSGGAGTYFPFSSVDGTMFNASAYATRDLTVNFGQWQYFDATDLSETSAAKGHFRFTPPTGFKACNNDNLKDIDSYQTALNITKNRDATDNWMVFDRVRGPSLDWHTNSINQQATNINTLQRFLKHGQQIGNDNEVNRDQDKFTSFNWYMETTGSGTANEVGGINTTRTLVDSTAGISTGIFEGTGSASTIGHGIGAVPKFIILKGLDNSSYSTVCYHVGMAATDPETDYIQLNSTDDAADDSGMWNDTAPTSTVFSVGTGSSVNKSGQTMAYYAFANIEGYSKFGSYEGNGGTSGNRPLIYTGFRPQLVIIKNVEANSTYWMTISRDRADASPQTPAGIDIQNPFQNYLQLNATTVDTGGYDSIDMLSTGFRVVNTTAWSSINTSGKRYIYMAWAEHPFGGESTTPVPAS